MLFAGTLAILAGYAIYAAGFAAHRGDGLAAIVMLVIAVIFWNRLTRTP